MYWKISLPLKNEVKFILIFIVLFTELKGLGIFSAGGIGKGNINLLSLLQIIVLIILLIILFYHKFKFIINIKSHITWFTIGIGILFLSALINAGYLFILHNYPLSNIINNIKQIHIYLFLFFLLYTLNHQEDINKVLKIVLLLSVLSSFIVFYVVIQGESTATIILLKGTGTIYKFRVLSATGTFVAFGFCYILSLILVEKQKKLLNIIILIILTGGVLIQMHRSVIISFALTLISAFFLLYGISLSRRTFIIILLSALILFIINKVVGYFYSDYDYFSKLIISTRNEFSGNTGTFIFRWRVFQNTLSFLHEKHHLLLGMGFKWEFWDFDKYWSKQFIPAPSNDNSFTNALIVFGIIGLITYCGLFISIIITSMMIFKKGQSSIIRILSFSTFTFGLYNLFTAYFSDNIMGSTNTVPFILLWGLTLKLDKIHYYGNETTKNISDSSNI